MTVAITTLPAYSSTPLARTHVPPKSRPYDEYRACLRLEFTYSCGFCLVSEMEVARLEAYGGFEIEHFKPQVPFKHLKNHYPNLLWSCHACNRAKGKTWPDAQEAAAGFRFVDPCADALGDHLVIKGHRVEAVAGSAAGAFTIDELDLNSPVHRVRRAERIKQVKAITTLEATLEQLKRISHEPDVVAAAVMIEAQLLEILPRVSPWDAPSSCRCHSAVPRQPKRMTRKQRKLARQRSVT